MDEDLILEEVALRKESVDRNSQQVCTFIGDGLSLSARRAWIEIFDHGIALVPHQQVALRKESVDRNQQSNIIKLIPGVALRKESVDRNRYHRDDVPDFRCRSPQGERG